MLNDLFALLCPPGTKDLVCLTPKIAEKTADIVMTNLNIDPVNRTLVLYGASAACGLGLVGYQYFKNKPGFSVEETVKNILRSTLPKHKDKIDLIYPIIQNWLLLKLLTQQPQLKQLPPAQKPSLWSWIWSQKEDIKQAALSDQLAGIKNDMIALIQENKGEIENALKTEATKSPDTKTPDGIKKASPQLEQLIKGILQEASERTENASKNKLK